jgi:hypothetical protein
MPPTVTEPGAEIALTLRVTNKGEAIWMSNARRGQIMLGWRWVGWSPPTPSPSVVHLNHDVFPRRSYEFPLTLSSPSDRGMYLLEVGLVSVTRGQAEWISRDPRDRLRFQVTVGLQSK